MALAFSSLERVYSAEIGLIAPINVLDVQSSFSFLYSITFILVELSFKMTNFYKYDPMSKRLIQILILDSIDLDRMFD
jgi:hypothetical protein